MKVLGLNRAELLVNDGAGAQAVFETLFNGGWFAPDSGLHDRPQDCRVNFQHGLELVQPFHPNYKIGALLQEKGQHVFTVVWDVDSLEAAQAHAEKNGFEVQYIGDYSAKPDVEDGMQDGDSL